MARGNRFTQNANGIGDVEVMGLYTFFGDIRKGGHRLVLIWHDLPYRLIAGEGSHR